MQTISGSFNSAVVAVDSPEGGQMFVTIIEDNNGKPFEFMMHIGKAGSALNAWCSALASMANIVIANGGTIEDIITGLSNITSDRIAYVSGDVPVRSGPDAFVLALVKYQRNRADRIKKQMKYRNRRGPRFGGFD